MTGALEEALGEEMVTDALINVGFPQDGQNFFELSLQSLKHDQFMVFKIRSWSTHLKHA